MDSLSSDLVAYLLQKSDNESGDLTLVCCDGEVKVHRNIMAARSPIFNVMLEMDMVEKASGRVEVKDFGKSSVKAMTKYIYTAQIDATLEDDIVELMKIGHKYLIKSLVDECGKKLSKEISKDNVLKLGVLADTFSVDNLLKSCAKFVLGNMEVLGDDWEKRLEDSPMFLMSIVRCVKEEEDDGVIQHNILRVSRFTGLKPLGMNCSGERVTANHDAIRVQLNKTAILTSVGLFGTLKPKDEISVEVEILNAQLVRIFRVETAYEGTGSNKPVDVPVKVKMNADTEYTVQVLIKSPGFATFSGRGGKAEVNYESNGLIVVFKQSSKSRKDTSVESGQIPALCFKLC